MPSRRRTLSTLWTSGDLAILQPPLNRPLQAFPPLVPKPIPVQFVREHLVIVPTSTRCLNSWYGRASICSSVNSAWRQWSAASQIIQSYNTK